MEEASLKAKRRTTGIILGSQRSSSRRYRAETGLRI
jgi:hypothetical protein